MKPASWKWRPGPVYLEAACSAACQRRSGFGRRSEVWPAAERRAARMGTAGRTAGWARWGAPGPGTRGAGAGVRRSAWTRRPTRRRPPRPPRLQGSGTCRAFSTPRCSWPILSRPPPPARARRPRRPRPLHRSATRARHLHPVTTIPPSRPRCCGGRRGTRRCPTRCSDPPSPPPRRSSRGRGYFGESFPFFPRVDRNFYSISIAYSYAKNKYRNRERDGRIAIKKKHSIRKPLSTFRSGSLGFNSVSARFCTLRAHLRGNAISLSLRAGQLLRAAAFLARASEGSLFALAWLPPVRGRRRKSGRWHGRRRTCLHVLYLSAFPGSSCDSPPTSARLSRCGRTTAPPIQLFGLRPEPTDHPEFLACINKFEPPRSSVSLNPLSVLLPPTFLLIECNLHLSV